MTEVMTKPSTNGERPLPRRAPKGLLPSTWQGRQLKVEYLAGPSATVSTSGTLLDTYPTGPVFNIEGAKTLIAWDFLVLLELKED